MTDEINNKLATTTKMPVASFNKTGIAGRRQAAVEEIKKLDPLTRPNRIGLVFDDSGSMSGQAIEDAKQGVRSFTASCKPDETSITIFPLNKSPQQLTCYYDVLNFYVLGIPATNGTPLYSITDRMLLTSNITRGVIFSDGCPNSESYSFPDGESSVNISYKQKVISFCIENKIPLDCIFIGLSETESGYKELKELAEKTNGIFVHFKDSKSLSTSLKYLTPAFRAMLMNEDLKQKIEKGEVI